MQKQVLVVKDALSLFYFWLHNIEPLDVNVEQLQHAYSTVSRPQEKAIEHVTPFSTRGQMLVNKALTD